MKFFILGIAFVAIIAMVFLKVSKQKSIVLDNGNQIKVIAQEKDKQENPYEGLREQALSVTSEMIGLKTTENDKNNTVYGVIIDWNTNTGIATIAAYKTGDASIYFSTGGGFIGGIGQPTVVDASKSLVEFSNKVLNSSALTKDISLPEKGNVKFFLLTNNGKFSHEETYSSLENSNSDWSSLFNYANNLITAYRELETKE